MIVAAVIIFIFSFFIALSEKNKGRYFWRTLIMSFLGLYSIFIMFKKL